MDNTYFEYMAKRTGCSSYIYDDMVQALVLSCVKNLLNTKQREVFYQYHIKHHKQIVISKNLSIRQSSVSIMLNRIDRRIHEVVKLYLYALELKKTQCYPERCIEKEINQYEKIYKTFFDNYGNLYVILLVRM